MASVLVVRTGFLGDTVTAIPALRMIRAWAPGAYLTILCDQPLGGQTAADAVLEPLALADRICTYRSRPRFQALLQMRALVRELRPNVAIVLGQARASRFGIAQWRFALRGFGVKDARMVNPIPPAGQTWPTETQRLCEGLRTLGVDVATPSFEMPVAQTARQAVARRLAALGLDQGKPYLVFCGGGKAPTQRWPLERYAAVLQRVVDETGLPVVAIGSPDELKRYSTLLRDAASSGHGRGVHRLEGLDLSQLFELLRGALAYIGNDTGPMHVAAAVGCPVVAVMSARNAPGQWYPEIDQRLVFRRDVPCQDCFLNECIQEAHRCMTEIGVDEVATQTLDFLDGLTPRSAALPGEGGT